MKKIVIKINTPKDNSLDKVRVYVGTSSDSASLFVPGNLVYEGVIQTVKTDKYTNKVRNHIGLEYFNDAGKRFRGMRPRSQYVIDDMGPWEFAKTKFIQGDEALGILNNSEQAMPAEFVLYQKMINEAQSRIAAKHGTNGIIAFPVYPPIVELNVFTVRGEILAFINSGTYYNATLARTQVSFAALEAMTEEERTIVVGGFKWRIEPIYREDINFLQEQLAHNQSTVGVFGTYTKKAAVLTDLPASIVSAYGAATAYGFATPFKTGQYAGQWGRWTGIQASADQTDAEYTYTFTNGTTTCQFMLRYVGRAD